MLDAQFIRENLDAVKANCKNRNVTADVDRVVALDDQRKQLHRRDAGQTAASKTKSPSQFPKEKDPGQEAGAQSTRARLRDKVASSRSQGETSRSRPQAALMTIPNMTHPDAPVGSTPADNKVIRTWGEPRKFDFKPKDHVALAEALDLVDFEAGAAVAGQKFYFLKNEAVLLELALVQYAMRQAAQGRYTPIITPDVARVDVLEGIGFIPRGPETQIYSWRTPTCA